MASNLHAITVIPYCQPGGGTTYYLPQSLPPNASIQLQYNGQTYSPLTSGSAVQSGYSQGYWIFVVNMPTSDLPFLSVSGNPYGDPRISGFVSGAGGGGNAIELFIGSTSDLCTPSNLPWLSPNPSPYGPAFSNQAPSATLNGILSKLNNDYNSILSYIQNNNISGAIQALLQLYSDINSNNNTASSQYGVNLQNFFPGSYALAQWIQQNNISSNPSSSQLQQLYNEVQSLLNQYPNSEVLQGFANILGAVAQQQQALTQLEQAYSSAQSVATQTPFSLSNAYNALSTLITDYQNFTSQYGTSQLPSEFNSFSDVENLFNNVLTPLYNSNGTYTLSQLQQLQKAVQQFLSSQNSLAVAYASALNNFISQQITNINMQTAQQELETQYQTVENDLQQSTFNPTKVNSDLEALISSYKNFVQTYGQNNLPSGFNNFSDVESVQQILNSYINLSNPSQQQLETILQELSKYESSQNALASGVATELANSIQTVLQSLASQTTSSQPSQSTSSQQPSQSNVIPQVTSSSNETSTPVQTSIQPSQSNTIPQITSSSSQISTSGTVTSTNTSSNQTSNPPLTYLQLLLSNDFSVALVDYPQYASLTQALTQAPGDTYQQKMQSLVSQALTYAQQAQQYLQSGDQNRAIKYANKASNIIQTIQSLAQATGDTTYISSLQYQQAVQLLKSVTNVVGDASISATPAVLLQQPQEQRAQGTTIAL